MPTNLPAKLTDYRLLGKSGIRISPLCLGTMTFGTDWGWGASPEVSKDILAVYADEGGNFIDTANYYTNGHSETIIGEWMKGKRDSFVLATKFTLNMRRNDPNAGGNSRKSLIQSFEASLKRLQTDYIDLLYVHAWDFTTSEEEVMRSLDDLSASGKVLAIAVSDAPAWKVAESQVLAEFRGWRQFVGLQVQYSLAERSIERDLIPMAIHFQLPVIPWAPLAGGVLSGKYKKTNEGIESGDAARKEQNKARLNDRNFLIAEKVAEIALQLGVSSPQIAIRWVMDRPGVVSPIIGVRTVDQLRDNLGALNVKLSSEQADKLDSISAIDLGFPHTFLASNGVKDIISGGTKIEGFTL